MKEKRITKSKFLLIVNREILGKVLEKGNRMSKTERKTKQKR